MGNTSRDVASPPYKYGGSGFFAIFLHPFYRVCLHGSSQAGLLSFGTTMASSLAPAVEEDPQLVAVTMLNVVAFAFHNSLSTNIHLHMLSRLA